MNPGILELNKRVAGIAAATSASLLDLHARVVDAQGELPEAMTTDGLHWKDAVYELLGKEIERSVRTR
jgi:lysophospholipase L1-like esterase